MPDLSSVASNLRNQAAASGTIVLDANVFSSSVLDHIRTAFALSGNLTVSGVVAANIPTNPTGSLSILGGSASVLGQDKVKIDILFVANGNSIDAIVTATMDKKWSFADSFKDLDTFPFQDLGVSDVHFVYATVAQPGFAWPTNASDKIALEAGLSFVSNATFSNYSLINDLVGKLLGDKPFKFYGPFAPTTGEASPVGEIRAQLTSGTFDVGVAPNALNLSNPAVAVRVGKSSDINPIQEIDLLVEATFNSTLEVAVGIPSTGGALSISTTPLPNQSSINSLIESLPGGKGFRSFIPSELSNIFANVGLDDFVMRVDPEPTVTYVGLSISTLQPWVVIPDVLTLQELKLRIETVEPTGLNWTRVFVDAKADFFKNIFHDPFDFIIELNKQASWEVSSVSGSYFGAVSLADIVGGLPGNSASTVPSALHGFAFSNFGARASRSAPGQPFSYSFYGSIEAAFPILETQVSSHLTLAVTKAGSAHTVALGGSILIGKEAFSVELDVGTADSRLSATWKSTGGPLEFADIAQAFGWNDMPDVPGSLDLGLTSAGFSYDFTTKALAFTAESQNYGHIAFVTEVVNGKRVYLFGLNVTIDASLSKIPLVGDEIPASADLTLESLQILLSSATFKSADIDRYNKWIGDLDKGLNDSDKWSLGGQDAPSGPSLVVNLSVGGDMHQLVLAAPPSKSQLQAPAARREIRATAAAATSAPGSSGNGLWLNLQKSLGPLYFNRVGVKYADGNIDFVLDAGLKMSALTLSLIGAGVGSSIKSFSPHFRIDGVAVDYQSGPVILSGGLIALRGADGSVTEYDGEVTLAAEQFELAALAGYSTAPTKSMFAFAILEAPLGGPPFLFVTGVAAGFGYNRDLIIPDAAGLPAFPLVQAVMGQSPFKGKADPGAAIEVLQKYIPQKSGENWVALGIRFTTFELLKSFALVTAKFGGEIEFDLIGMSALSIPSETPSPIAYAELALVGSFKVEEGSLAISAQLTPASFVLDRDCHLTGGFAFYFWGKDSASGARAGDFVVTLGGYHPAFKRPSWYPVEPLLGANWQVSSNLTVKGGYYFALTPSTVMAGGMLEAVWQSGDLKAWFNAHADFLLCWKPFHYEAEIGISLGASYRVDLLFTSITVTVHVGVELDFWGPSFAGRAKVDLYVCTLTITFGDSSPSVDPIAWNDFKSSFLPPPASPAPQASARPRALARRAMLAAAPDGAPYSDSPYCTMRASAGMSQDLTRGKRINTDDMDWVVNAEMLELVTLCVIPSTEANLPQNFTRTGGDAAWNWSKSFGVGPVGIANGELVSSHAITLVGLDQTGTGPIFDVTPLLKSVPSATWSKDVALKPGIATANAQPATIGGVLTGFGLRPSVTKPDQLSEIDLRPLQFTQDPTVRIFAWSQPAAPPADTFHQTDAMKQFTDSLASSGAGDARNALLAVLKAQNVGDLASAKVDVSTMSKSAADVLLSAPVLSYLGDQRKAA